MNKQGTVTKTEKLLLGLTALFLAGLLLLSVYDRQQSGKEPAAVETERTAAQEEVLAELVLLDLNSATEAELAGLPGIGEELARRIVEYREANGPFDAVEEIMEVSGIGEKKFEDMKERITVEETT